MKKKRLEVGKDISEEEYKRHFKNALSNFGGLGVEDLEGCQCSKCKHYIGNDKCKAFPKGIPFGIPEELFIHDKVHPDQKNKIIFEPKNL